MLESLHLLNVGPAPEMKMELAPRLNLIRGQRARQELPAGCGVVGADP